MGEVVPVGLCFATPQGHLTYANNTWYEITGFAKGTGPAMSFISCVAEEDAQMVSDCWLQLISTGVRTNFEFRIKPKIEDRPDASTDGSTPSTSDTRSGYDGDQSDASMVDNVLGGSNSHRFKWALATVSPIPAEDGTAEMITVSLTDITVHKRTAEEAILRAQQAERASELLARFKRMADYATVGLFDLSPDGKIVQANDTFYKIMGLTKRDLELDPSQCWLDAILEEDFPIVRKNQETLRTQGKPIADEIRLKKP
jgi:PAS domain-containing protein